MKFRFYYICGLLLFGSYSILGNTIILKNGTVIRGKITSQNENEISISEQNGKARKLSKSETLKVLYKDPSEKEIQNILKENQSPVSKKDEAGNSNSNSPNNSGNGQGFLRIYGDLFLGNLQSDWERRSIVSNIFAGRLESDWSGKTRTGLKLGGEIYGKMNDSSLTHFFIGIDISRFERNYSSNAIGFTIANGETNANLSILKLNAGLVWEIQPSLRLKPKLNIFRLQQILETKTDTFGLVNGLGYVGTGNGNITNIGLTSTLGLALEYDLQNDFSLLADFHFISPFLYEGKGTHKASSQEMYAIDQIGGMQRGNSNGNYVVNINGYSLGFTKQINSQLRFYGMYENLSIATQITRPIGSTISIVQSAGVVTPSADIVGTSVRQTLFYSQKESIHIQGLRFGISADINFTK